MQPPDSIVAVQKALEEFRAAQARVDAAETQEDFWTAIAETVAAGERLEHARRKAHN